MFPLLHWHTRSCDSISFSPSSPCSFSFLSSIPLVFGTLPFHPFYLQTLPLSFPLSLSPCSSFTLNLAFLCPLLAPISNIFLALSLPLLVPSIADLCPPINRLSLMLSNIIMLLLKSPPYFLSYSSHTFHYLICLNKCYHIALISRLISVSKNETFSA
jgi:hypothetical protein